MGRIVINQILHENTIFEKQILAMNDRILLGLSLEELVSICFEAGFGTEEGLTLANYIYKKRARSFDEMELLPNVLLQYLSENTTLGTSSYCEIETAADGTKKYLFPTEGGNYVETNFLPNKTLLISGQAGCQMGCAFCTTANIGYQENLLPHDILNQIISIDDYSSINRVVLMGMGEPLEHPSSVEKCLGILTSGWGLAFGASKITLSTFGIADQLESIISKRVCNIDIVLHSPFPEERAEFIPSEHKYPIVKSLDVLRKNQISKPLHLSFEYMLLSGKNDSPAHAVALAGLLNGLKCNVNLIPFNTYQSSEFMAPSMAEVNQFQLLINLLGVETTLRNSKGQDTNETCGQLTANNTTNSGNNE